MRWGAKSTDLFWGELCPILGRIRKAPEKRTHAPTRRHTKKMKNTSAFDLCSKIDLLQLLVCLLLFFLLLLLFSIPILTPEEDQGSKALVFFILCVCRRVGEYVSLELFCFVSLTSSCSLISWKNFFSFCSVIKRVTPKFACCVLF